MVKKDRYIAIILILILLLTSITFTGCITNDSTSFSTKNYKDSDFIDINAPDTAFFNENIDFDIEKIKDIETSILSHTWDFQDGKRLDGKKVSHKYDFSNDMKIEYPLIYTVTLYTRCSDNSIRINEHQIKLYPKQFVLYLDKNSLENKIPEKNYEKLSNGILSINDVNEYFYKTNEPVYLDECRWELDLNLNKGLLSRIKNVKIVLFNENNTKISEGNTDSSKLKFKTDIDLEISGKIKEKSVLKGIKLVFVTSSLMINSRLVYGGENPSKLVFNFVE